MKTVRELRRETLRAVIAKVMALWDADKALESRQQMGASYRNALMIVVELIEMMWEETDAKS